MGRWQLKFARCHKFWSFFFWKASLNNKCPNFIKAILILLILKFNLKSKYVLHSYKLWKFQQSIGNKSQTHLLQSRVTGSPWERKNSAIQILRCWSSGLFVLQARKASETATWLYFFNIHLWLTFHIIIAVFQKIATLRTVSDNKKIRHNRNED